MTFDLRSFVRSVIDANPDEPNPHRLAEKVLAELPSSHFEEALAETLPGYVRTFEHAPVRTSAPASSSGVSRSPRWEQASAAARFLAERVCVDEEASEWKTHADCTVEDVERLAAYRHALAAAVEAKATLYERLAEKLRCHRAATVADLGPDLIGEVLR